MEFETIVDCTGKSKRVFQGCTVVIHRDMYNHRANMPFLNRGVYMVTRVAYREDYAGVVIYVKVPLQEYPINFVVNPHRIVSEIEILETPASKVLYGI